jgi:hypothetical protein
MSRLVRQMIPLTMLIMLLASMALGQVISGTISGTVKDPSGAVVAGAKVTLRSDAIGFTRTSEANPTGNFVFPNVPPATYTVVVEAAGFKKLETTGVILNAADRVSMPFTLEVGAANAEVTVAADAGQVQLQAESGERSDLISNKQLNEVAMNGSNVLDYMKLIPGVISGFDGHASGTGGLSSMNINGSRGNQHEFTIDGASNVDTGDNGGTHVTINTDAIAEVKVLTSNYQAEYGKAAGGQIAIVTKAGTNQFHGGVTFTHRHEGLNANDWFAKQQGQPNGIYRYNFTGYNIGGPVTLPGMSFNKNKDKLFFFWSQQYYAQVVPSGGFQSFYTPTALERQGDFSQSTDVNGNPVEIAGPGIANNKIVSGINPQMQKMLNLFPLPNLKALTSNGSNFGYTQSVNDPRREDIIRVDYQMNAANRIFARYLHNSDTEKAPYEGFPGPFGIFACSSVVNFPGGCVQKHPGWNLSVNVVTTIRPNLLNEFSIGPSVSISDAQAVNGNSTRGANGITLPLLYPVDSTQSIPDLSFGGVNGINFQGPYLGATPWYQHNTTINANDGLSWILHNHTLKTGFFFQRSRKDQIAWGNVNGQFGFNGGPTSPGSCPAAAPNCNMGDPLASELLGDYASFDQSSARPVGRFRYSQAEFYIQDTWKVSNRLTLDYGMRFSWIPPQTDANNQIALFVPSAYNPALAVQIDPQTMNVINGTGDPMNGMQFTKNGELPVGGWNSRGVMPEPRLGFAYDVFGDHKTILRGGFGLMHDRTQGNLIFNTVFNNPALVVTPSLPAGNVTGLPSASTASAESPVLSNVFGAASNGKIPTVYSYSLGFQRELAKGTTLDVAYVGNVARHLVTTRDLNALPNGYAFSQAAQDPTCSLYNGTVPSVQPGLQPQYAAAGFSYNGWCAYGWDHGQYSNNYMAPYKGYQSANGNDGIRYMQFDGTSNYNSLQASLQRRFSKGLIFGAVYTWSKSLTTASADQDYQDPFNPKLDYRAPGWDRTHVFAANYVYDIPGVSKHLGGSKWLGYITDGYQLSGVTQFQTGTPIDSNNGGSFPGGYITGSDQWPVVNFNYTFDKHQNIIFPKIGAPTRGTRDLYRQGGMQNWDMSIFKNIPVGEHRSLQLRAEGFNAFNHPNFATKHFADAISYGGPLPWGNATDPLSLTKNSNFGQPSSQYSGVGGPRRLQLGARFTF